jgi:hypothetical protein
MALRGNQGYDGHQSAAAASFKGEAMSCASRMRPIVPIAFASIVAALSPTLAHSASLFICNVTAADGGCVNGTSTPAGFVTFDFSGFLGGDSFVGGSPATSPAQAAASGKIDFSFSWHTLSPGVDTPEQTVFFVTPGGLVADVLDYASSVFGGAGRDFMIISGYVLPLATPVTVADLASQGITSTGSVSLPVLYEFPTTDLTATFQPAPIPELPTWGLIGLGFAGLGLSGSFIAGKRAAVAA